MKKEVNNQNDDLFKKYEQNILKNLEYLHNNRNYIIGNTKSKRIVSLDKELIKLNETYTNGYQTIVNCINSNLQNQLKRFTNKIQTNCTYYFINNKLVIDVKIYYLNNNHQFYFGINDNNVSLIKIGKYADTSLVPYLLYYFNNIYFVFKEPVFKEKYHELTELSIRNSPIILTASNHSISIDTTFRDGNTIYTNSPIITREFELLKSNILKNTYIDETIFDDYYPQLSKDKNLQKMIRKGSI